MIMRMFLAFSPRMQDPSATEVEEAKARVVLNLSAARCSAAHSGVLVCDSCCCQGSLRPSGRSLSTACSAPRYVQCAGTGFARGFEQG